MWDVTITPSLDPASPLASLIRLVHAPTISGWAMTLIPFVTTRFLIKNVSENFDFFTYRYDTNNDVIEVKINSGVHLSFTIIHQNLLNKLNI
jgi:hypothetical protein